VYFSSLNPPGERFQQLKLSIAGIKDKKQKLLEMKHICMVVPLPNINNNPSSKLWMHQTMAGLAKPASSVVLTGKEMVNSNAYHDADLCIGVQCIPHIMVHVAIS
jgi:hypothetical protein